MQSPNVPTISEIVIPSLPSVSPLQPPLMWEVVSFEEEPSKPVPRTKFSSVMYNGKLIVYGGGVAVTFYSDLYEYDFVEGRWRCVQVDTEVVPGGPCKRRSHKAVVWGNQMIVFGGRTRRMQLNDIHMLDLDTYEWKKKVPREGAAVPCPRAAHTACMWGKRMVIFGGDRTLGKEQMFLGDLWSYNCETSKWREMKRKGDVPSKRLGHVCGVKDDTMYLFGGYNGSALNDMYACDLRHGMWRRIAYHSLVMPVSFAAMVEAREDEALYMFGGSNTDMNSFADILYKFDCKTEEFEVVKSLGQKPMKRLGHALEVWGDKLVVYGGCCSGYFDDMYVANTRVRSLKEVMAHFIVSSNIPYGGKQQVTAPVARRLCSPVPILSSASRSPPLRGTLTFPTTPISPPILPMVGPSTPLTPA